MKRTFTQYMTALSLLALGGCAGQHAAPHQADSALADSGQQAADFASQQAETAFSPPSAVIDELLAPSALAPRAPVLAEPQFQLSARGVDAKAFFASLVADTPYSMAIHPDVSGTIDLELKDVTLTEALAAVTDLYGYDVQRRGKIYHVYPAGMRTETFQVDYLTLQRQARSQIQISTAQLTNTSSDSNSSQDASNSSSDNSSDNSSANINGTQIHSYSNTDFWQELQAVLEDLLGCQRGSQGSPLQQAATGLGALVGQADASASSVQSGGNHCHSDGRAISISPQAGLVTVRAMPSDLRVIRDYLQTSQQHLQRQVILEARILEVALKDGFQQGIQWQSLSSDPGAPPRASYNNELSAALGGLNSLVLQNSNFSATIDLLQTQGDVEVLSSPRVTALNNQKAVIKAGSDEYFVTNVSTTTVTGTATTSTPTLELTPFFSGVSLDVLPQIDANGTVTMHVRPSVSKVNEQNKRIQLTGTEMDLPLALSELRETDTLVRARSGEIVVIGGLMTTEQREEHSQVPVLGSIPVMGKLFQSTHQSTEKLELVILIKPTVVGETTWQDQITHSRQNIQRWYPQLNTQVDSLSPPVSSSREEL